MRINGMIWTKSPQPLTEKETPFDADGNPVQSSSEWSDPIPACIQTISENRRADYEDGKYLAGTFRIHIELPHPSNWPLGITQIKLSRAGENMGEFPVMSCQILPSMGRVEIIV